LGELWCVLSVQAELDFKEIRNGMHLQENLPFFDWQLQG
jgi:hypothetical protein